MLANTSSLNDFLPFSQLNNNEFQTYIYQQSEIDLNDNEIERFRNLSFNPFSQSSHGKTCLALNPDLDPDQNYYNQIMTHIKGCDDHDEDTFHCMTKDSKESEFSILHLNIPSILNKFDDLKVYLNSLEYKFSIIGFSETWLFPDTMNELPLTGYHSIGKVGTNKQGGGVGLYLYTFEFTSQHEQILYTKKYRGAIFSIFVDCGALNCCPVCSNSSLADWRFLAADVSLLMTWRVHMAFRMVTLCVKK